MYRDPKLRRNIDIKVRFDSYEYELIEALTDFSGRQQAEFLHEIVANGIQQYKAKVEAQLPSVQLPEPKKLAAKIAV
mgnify:CR=1 FL=1